MNKKIIILPIALLSLTTPLVYALDETEEQIVKNEELKENEITITNNIIDSELYNIEEDLLLLEEKDINADLNIIDSTITIKLINSKLNSNISESNSQVSMYLDTNSTLNLKSDLYLESLIDEDDTYSNIDFGEYKIYINEEELVLDNIEETSTEEVSETASLEAITSEEVLEVQEEINEEVNTIDNSETQSKDISNKSTKKNISNKKTKQNLKTNNNSSTKHKVTNKKEIKSKDSTEESIESNANSSNKKVKKEKKNVEEKKTDKESKKSIKEEKDNDSEVSEKETNKGNILEEIINWFKSIFNNFMNKKD